ncbi:uncharacterized protein LOC135096375 isoform X1 [Scylla paramamosain]|uniref:uncharacterized protein LOC135095122 isoform X1 n=1 Tax=Scylla paramamosain TaxID=85552 RepID=UPI0030839CA5
MRAQLVKSSMFQMTSSSAFRIQMTSIPQQLCSCLQLCLHLPNHQQLCSHLQLCLHLPSHQQLCNHLQPCLPFPIHQQLCSCLQCCLHLPNHLQHPSHHHHQLSSKKSQQRAHPNSCGCSDHELLVQVMESQ